MPDGQEVADLLILLGEWEWAHQGMIEELSRAKAIAIGPCPNGVRTRVSTLRG